MCSRKQEWIMKRRHKKRLTRASDKSSIRRMPNSKSTRPGRLKRLLRVKKSTVERQYNQFFVPDRAHDEEVASLDQPSPYKWVETETTYGVETPLCPIPDA